MSASTSARGTGMVPASAQMLPFMPDPVYGAPLQGAVDEIFPKDKQWRDPGSGTLKEQQ